MTTAPLTAEELGRLVDSLFQRSTLTETAVVAGCLLLAWRRHRAAFGVVRPPCG
jgi:hypothetical protein